MQALNIIRYIDYFLMAIAMAMSFYAWHKERTTPYFILMSLLFFLVCHNTISAFIPTIGNLDSWAKLGNIFVIIELGTYYPIYYFLLKRKLLKRVVKYWIIAFVLLSLISLLFFKQESANYSTYSLLFGGIGIIVSILFYFIELFDSEANPFNQFWFWVSLGLFLFLAADLPFLVMINFLRNSLTIVKYEIELYSFKTIMSAFYYLLFIIAIRCKIKK